MKDGLAPGVEEKVPPASQLNNPYRTVGTTPPQSPPAAATAVAGEVITTSLPGAGATVAPGIAITEVIFSVAGSVDTASPV
jgi:hypothetical protein